MFLRKTAVLILMLVCACFLSQAAEAAPTSIFSNITSNHTWNTAGSPYIVSAPVNVSVNRTLTIEAGTVVKFTTGAGLTVAGTLIAAGSPGNLVYFTDYRDDTVGGDSNGDVDATRPAAGGWAGISVNGGSAAFDYSSIRYGGAYGYGNVYFYGSGNSTATNSTVSDSSSYGIHIYNTVSPAVITNCTVSANSNDGIYLQNNSGAITVAASSVTGNGGYGIRVNATPTLAVTSGIVTGNSAGAVRLAAENLASLDVATQGDTVEIDGGSISRATSLIAAIPYVVNSLVPVNSTVTLSVPAGTVVKFGPGAGLDVSGTLNASGSIGNPVHFTDRRDDSAGGDTNGDGTVSAPAAGGWNGLMINDGGSAALAYSSIRYGYNNVSKFGTGTLSMTDSLATNASAAGISISGSPAAHSITGSTVSGNGSDGILFSGNSSGTISVTGTTLSANGGSGINANSGTLALQNNTVTGNNGYALDLSGGTLSPSIAGNSFSGNAAGAFRLQASHLPLFSDIPHSGNIVINGGTVSQSATLNASYSYVIAGTFTVGAAGALTAPAGTVLKFAPGTGIDVAGALNAIGVDGNMVYFSELRDDSAGGDTNGDGISSGAAGAWRGIIVTGTGNAAFAYSTLRFGGDTIYCDGSGSISISNSIVSNSSGNGILMALSGADLTVTGSRLADNGTSAIRLSNSTGVISVAGNTISYNGAQGISAEGAGTNPVIRNNVIAHNNVGVSVDGGADPVIGGSATPGTGNSIFQNGSFGVQNIAGSVTVDATYNWWGTSGGPYHPAGNPAGTGNAVSSFVTFNPWLSDPTFSAAVAVFTPEHVDFKRVAVGGPSVAQNISVVNISGQPLAFGTVSLSGQNPGEFQVTSDSCSNATLVPAGSCVVTLTFTPTAKLSRSASLDFPAGGASVLPLYSVAIKGNGVTALPFSDDFAGATSLNNYQIINPALPNPTVLTGNLNSYASYNTSLDPVSSSKNLFTLALPIGITKMMVTTKLNLPAVYLSNAPQGGIILLSEKDGQPDLSTYIRTHYRGVSDPLSRKFQSVTDVQGVLTPYNDTAMHTVNDVWLRLVKRDNTYQSYFSIDGITFTPLHNALTLQQEAAYAGLLALRESGTRADCYVYFDTLGVEALPTMSAPASVAFGNVPFGSTHRRDVTISNTGSGPLSVTALNVSGTNAALFSVDPGSCSLPVPPGGTCSLSLTMSASVMGPVSATLAIGSNDIDTPTVSVPVSGTVATPVPLTVGFLGTGGGTLRYVSQDTVCGTDCTVYAATGGTAAFQAVPDGYSLFTGWGGTCSGTSTAGSYSFTVPGSACSVTATFDRDTAHSVKIEPGWYYATILEAYGGASAAGTTTIKTWGTDYTEPLPLTFDQDRDILLDGGYDGTFSSISGMTTILGKMTVVIGAAGGRVDVRNITIKTPP